MNCRLTLWPVYERNQVLYYSTVIAGSIKLH